MHIVTASHDRSIRLWERTDEPLILDEEKEQVRLATFVISYSQRAETSSELEQCSEDSILLV